jgi:hypothetical protein
MVTMMKGAAARPLTTATNTSSLIDHGEYVNGRAAKFLGWLTAALMSVAAIALFATGGV